MDIEEIRLRLTIFTTQSGVIVFGFLRLERSNGGASFLTGDFVGVPLKQEAKCVKMFRSNC